MATFGVVRSDSDYDLDILPINTQFEKRSSSAMSETDSNSSWKPSDIQDQASRIAQYVQQRQDDMDRREAQLNARSAELDNAA
ncbi:MAG: hypothetical protein IKW80_09320, partial [Thermoguttaceae bacterium]|nr:hypothetical protein [Thermoguttaceae bacterium]